jgi:hypothetical protein
MATLAATLSRLIEAATIAQAAIEQHDSAALDGALDTLERNADLIHALAIQWRRSP